MQSIEWNNPSNDDLINELVDIVSETFDLKNKDKVTSEGKNFKSNNFIPRHIRTLLRRKKEASNELLKCKKIERCIKLKKKLLDAEKELKIESKNRKLKEEAKVLENMHKNPSSFYTYAKRKKGNL